MAAPNCAICNGADAKFCASCRSISYCSPKCQKTDWPLHKTICKPLTTLPPRPSPSHKLGLLFPIDAQVPQPAWVDCERRVDSDYGTEWEKPDIHDFLQSENLDPEYQNAKQYMPITKNTLRGFSLDHTVEITCRETFLVDGSTSNECIRQTTKGRMAHDWRGPVVVMRQPGTAIDPKFYEDIMGADLRVVVDYFLTYGRNV